MVDTTLFGETAVLSVCRSASVTAPIGLFKDITATFSTDFNELYAMGSTNHAAVAKQTKLEIECEYWLFDTSLEQSELLKYLYHSDASEQPLTLFKSKLTAEGGKTVWLKVENIVFEKHQSFGTANDWTKSKIKGSGKNYTIA